MSRRAPLDALLTYVGCVFAAFVPVSAVASVLLPADAFASAEQLAATAVVAAPVAAAYWRARLSLGDLGEFVFTTMALALLVGFATMLVLGTLDAAPATGTPENAALTLGFVGVVNGLAYVLVYRDGRALLWDSTA